VNFQKKRVEVDCWIGLINLGSLIVVCKSLTSRFVQTRTICRSPNVPGIHSDFFVLLFYHYIRTRHSYRSKRSSKPHLTFSLVTRNCKIRFWYMWLPKYPDIRNQQCESVMSIWCSITWQLYNQQQEHSYSMRCPRVSIFIAEWREQPTNICRIHKLYNDRSFWGIQIPQHSGASELSPG